MLRSLRLRRCCRLTAITSVSFVLSLLFCCLAAASKSSSRLSRCCWSRCHLVASVLLLPYLRFCCFCMPTAAANSRSRRCSLCICRLVTANDVVCILWCKIPYSSSSASLYHLLPRHWSPSYPITFHYTFTHKQTPFQFIIHLPISRSDQITYC